MFSRIGCFTQDGAVVLSNASAQAIRNIAGLRNILNQKSARFFTISVKSAFTISYLEGSRRIAEG